MWTKRDYAKCAQPAIAVTIVCILLWPICQLLMRAFSLQLLAYTLVILLLSFFTYRCYVNEGSTDRVLSSISVITGVLFFSSTLADYDLGKIKMLTGITLHNCEIARGIQQGGSTAVDYSLYRVDEFVTNAGFTADRFGIEPLRSLMQASYNMSYSNRLSEKIMFMDTPADAVNAEMVAALIAQQKLLAEEIEQLMECNNLTS